MKGKKLNGIQISIERVFSEFNKKGHSLLKPYVICKSTGVGLLSGESIKTSKKVESFINDPKAKYKSSLRYSKPFSQEINSRKQEGVIKNRLLSFVNDYTANNKHAKRIISTFIE